MSFFKLKTNFVPFIVAGDPSFEMSEKVIDILVEEGADALELGVPFSDALADGPVIQTASERTSARVDSIEEIIRFAKKVNQKHPQLPLILFTYYNPLLQFGLQNFAQSAANANVAAILVVDLPVEEAEDYLKAISATSLQTVFLISPTTSPERKKIIADASSGFIYYVSRTGVTGTQNQLSLTLASELAELRKVMQSSGNPKPIAIGFGISTAEQAKTVAGLGDAVVVGSAFVKIISSSLPEAQILKEVRTLAKSLSEAIHG